MIDSLPIDIQELLFWHVWDLAGQPSESHFGKVHVLDSPDRLLTAIKRITSSILEKKSPNSNPSVVPLQSESHPVVPAGLNPSSFEARILPSFLAPSSSVHGQKIVDTALTLMGKLHWGSDTDGNFSYFDPVEGHIANDFQYFFPKGALKFLNSFKMLLEENMRMQSILKPLQQRTIKCGCAVGNSVYSFYLKQGYSHRKKFRVCYPCSQIE